VVVDAVIPLGVSEAEPREEVDKVALGQVEGAPKLLETTGDIVRNAVPLPTPNEDIEGEGDRDKDNEGEELPVINITDGEASRGVSVPGTTLNVPIADIDNIGDREATEEAEGAKGVPVTEAVLVGRIGENVI